MVNAGATAVRNLVPGGTLCATWDQLQDLAREIDKMYVGADHPTWTSF